MPYNQSDVQKLKFLANQVKKLDEFFDSKHDDPTEKMQFDAVEMAERLYRYGRMTYSDEDWALLYAFLNSPVSDKMYKKQENEKKGLPSIRKLQAELAEKQAAGALSAELEQLQNQIQAAKEALAARNVLYNCDNPITTYTEPDARSSIPRRLANTATNTLCPPRAKTFCA